MAIHVKSEIGKLKKVMLHRPGQELEHLVPEDLERLLFDDIPYLKTAKIEHDMFAEIMRGQGVEVVYLEDLTADVLKNPEKKEQFVREFIAEGGASAAKVRDQLYDYLMKISDEKELVLKTMSGIRASELNVKMSCPLVSLVKKESQFLLDPIPNLYFTRDPFACIGNGVSLNRMYSRTRRRETLYGKYILKYHPDFAGKVPFYYDRTMDFAIEGGDILNLSNKVIAIGISQRTTPEAIELLAQNIFVDKASEIETIIALDIPAVRAFMHLDTVCTQVDYDKFTIHPGIMQTLRIFEIKPGDRKGQLKVTESDAMLSDILAKYLELDKVTLIKCGGKDRIASEREQWNDGSNTLCIEPGKVVVYDRNYVTNEILRQHGIEVLEMASSELSRGRGGPRCMSMPLEREDLSGGSFSISTS
ncbi:MULTISPECIES: arginine deiminase [Clostridia]|uniref:arginine deiminase n=1 Tax=Clostridia TaxID=186801 RepID=UPI000E5298AF|nr:MULTISPECIES: arginine deiminase [Clostridia]RHV72037.1 arginine deiminase [Roseburia sp. OM02-15]